MENQSGKSLSSVQCEELLSILKTRFENNMHRHQDLEWANVQVRLDADLGKM